MMWLKRIIAVALVVVLVVGSSVVAYRKGYQDGRKSLNPPLRGIAVVRGAGNPKSSGTSYSWYDLGKPEEAARFRKRQDDLKASGANFYITEPQWERSMNPSPDPRRVNAQL